MNGTEGVESSTLNDLLTLMLRCGLFPASLPVEIKVSNESSELSAKYAYRLNQQPAPRHIKQNEILQLKYLYKVPL